MERLWAPWREAYITAPKNEKQGCIFCDKPRTERDEEAYILYRAPRTFVMLNTFPYNPGHLMVAPFAHVGDLENLDRETLAELMDVTRQCVQALRAAVHPEGFNVGMNLGAPAGAGVVDHLHMHVVPRWGGDTNFMSVVSGVRVLPQGLDRTYEILRPHFTRGA
jgi:ATP adenylyltransferase